jgi:hypothetical protein
MAPDLRGVRMLVVGTSREQEMGRVPGALAELARVSRRVTLRGLRAGDVAQFVRTAAGVAPLFESALHRFDVRIVYRQPQIVAPQVADRPGGGKRRRRGRRD